MLLERCVFHNACEMLLATRRGALVVAEPAAWGPSVIDRDRPQVRIAEVLPDGRTVVLASREGETSSTSHS